jgi:hypothetical protein
MIWANGQLEVGRLTNEGRRVMSTNWLVISDPHSGHIEIYRGQCGCKELVKIVYTYSDACHYLVGKVQDGDFLVFRKSQGRTCQSVELRGASFRSTYAWQPVMV